MSVFSDFDVIKDAGAERRQRLPLSFVWLGTVERASAAFWLMDRAEENGGVTQAGIAHASRGRDPLC